MSKEAVFHKKNMRFTNVLRIVRVQSAEQSGIWKIITEI